MTDVPDRYQHEEIEKHGFENPKWVIMAQKYQSEGDLKWSQNDRYAGPCRSHIFASMNTLSSNKENALELAERKGERGKAEVMETT